ncbi:MAG: hypothetical protein JXA13_08975 [Anaerolineales bacterium]|nr:hypothetical protein [Anaerolineales bacterium]
MKTRLQVVLLQSFNSTTIADMENFLPALDIRELYDRFDVSVTGVDCGKHCALHNPSGKPFCCDICLAVPVAYHQEWEYLCRHTDLWHTWMAGECPDLSPESDFAQENFPEHMCLLACQGPADCQRSFRALSCRQFPFFPYITSDYRFLGMAYDWTFEETCWVINNLVLVTNDYRRAFFQTFDFLFSLWDEEFESYIIRSSEMRSDFKSAKRRIPVLHRNGKAYMISPQSERMKPVDLSELPRFGPYR